MQNFRHELEYPLDTSKSMNAAYTDHERVTKNCCGISCLQRRAFNFCVVLTFLIINSAIANTICINTK